MVFSSLTFLFAFLPALMVCYFGLARRRDTRNFILLAFSVLFYSWGGWSLVPLLLLSVTMNWFFGQRVAEDNPRRKLFLVLAVTGNLGLLFIFKYLGFATEILASLIPTVVPVKIVLPIGISFYTFQGLSYVLDVYMGSAAPTRKVSQVALYIALFPQLVAGPIVRYTTVCEELDTRQETTEDAFEGVIRFCFGLAKKVLIANQMGALADSAFGQSSTLMSSGLAWLGVIGYSLQIYFDFSGYSDMAIGLGRIFGFHFLENFDYPYISKSITEFWRRWHMSLGTWFRDYLYLPLGGNRVSRWKHIRNILTVWMLTGLWHGAAWNFVLWGVYYGLLLLVEKFLWGRALARCPKVLQHLYTLFFVAIGWLLFRATDLSIIADFLKAMFGGAADGAWNNHATYLLLQYRWELMAGCILSCPVFPPIRRWLEKRQGAGAALQAVTPVLALLLAVWSCLRLVGSGFNPFIYFQF